MPDIRVCGCNSYHGHGDLLEELWVLEGEGGGWKKKEIKRCKEGWRS